MSPAFNGSSALERFKRSNAIEIRNGITFDFYLRLPHVSSMCEPQALRTSALLHEIVILYKYAYAISSYKAEVMSVTMNKE